MKWSGILIAVSVLLSLQGCMDSSQQESTALVPRIGSGVVSYEGVEPKQLFLGAKQGGAAQKCVHAVVVRDVDLACSKNRCDVKAFYLPVRPVSNFQRALHVTDCNKDAELTSGHLLTDLGEDGSTAILYFQASRSGNGLWKQTIEPDGRYAIEFATEAAEGILLLNAQGQYDWVELPD
jgi:hypothetical protein